GRAVSVTSLFFFQAEDGIRDSSVTGVQTCALPISEALKKRAVESGFADVFLVDTSAPAAAGAKPGTLHPRTGQRAPQHRRLPPKIGRASCRERGQSSGARPAGRRRSPPYGQRH